MLIEFGIVLWLFSNVLSISHKRGENAKWFKTILDVKNPIFLNIFKICPLTFHSSMRPSSKIKKKREKTGKNRDKKLNTQLKVFGSALFE